MTSNERRTGAQRGLRFFIAALSLSIAIIALTAMPVLAAETTTTTTSSTETGYSQKPAPPKEEKKVAPAKEEKEAAPKKAVEPAKEVVTPAPAAEAAPATAQTLPFTGLDLRWVLGAGVLMIAAGGISLRVMRRRERHGMGR